MKTRMHKFVAVVAGVTMFIAPSIASASSGVGTTDWGTSGSSSTVTTTSTSTLPSWTLTATSGSGSESWNSSASLPSWTATATSGSGVADWTATTATTASTSSLPDWTKTATSGSGTGNWNTTAALPSWTSTATSGTGTSDWSTTTTTSTLPSWTSTATSGTGTTDWNSTTLPEWTKTATSGSGTTDWGTNLPSWTESATKGTGNSDWNAPIECQGEAVLSNPTFPDTATHWGREFICRAYKLGIISGYLAGPHQGLFKPDNNVTRAELLKTVMKMQGIQLSNTSAKSTFKDVEANAWYTGYVAKAKELGIVEGYKDGTFKPHKAVNRAEAVKIILLASGLTQADVSAEAALQTADADGLAEFSDVKESLWFANYVSLARKKGILMGKEDGLFHASDNMTRAEMVKVVLLSFDTIR